MKSSGVKGKFSHIFLLSTILLSVVSSTAGPVYVAAADDITSDSQTESKKNSNEVLEASKAKTLKELVRQQDSSNLSLLEDSFFSSIEKQLAAKGINTEELSLTDLKSQKIRVIVNLKGKSGIEKDNHEVKDFKTADATEEAVLKKQDDSIQQAEEITGNKVEEQFGYLANGFSIDATVGQISEIEKLDEVESVDVTEVVTPQDTDAGALVQAQTAWEEQNVKGEGMVVAIIDSGIDTTHKDLRLSDESTAKLSKEDVESEIDELGYGVYASSKVPFAHNYGDGNDSELHDTTGEMHGMHVAGIVAANGENPDNRTSVEGVAPEAQLLDMKVFANHNVDGPTTDVVVQAIEDSVKLGADVINMSLGTDDGGSNQVNAELMAIENAAKAGVLPVISAGNSGLATSMGGALDTQAYNFIDDGLMSEPGISEYAFTVASSENSNMSMPTTVISCDGKPILDGQSIPVQYNTDVVNKTFPTSQMVVLKDQAKTAEDGKTAVAPVASGLPGRGFKADFTNTDVKDKVVILSRGDNKFSEKQENALSNGAVGLIIVDNSDSYSPSAGIDNEYGIPTLFVEKQLGLSIVQAVTAQPNAMYSFTSFETKVVSNPLAKEMSDFTTWGPNTNLEIKPDISAPGGNIWSLANENSYQNMSGTSMSSPMVAGSEALILQSFKGNTQLTGLDLVNAAKLTAMNTAVPLLDPEHGNTPYSPRRQGSGQIQISEAINNFVTLKYAGKESEEPNGKGSASLKQIQQKTTFKVTLTNNGQKEVSYNFDDFGGVYTKAVDETSIVYDTKIEGATLTSDEQTIALKPGESKDVTLQLTLPDNFSADQWAEGYFGFKSNDENVPDLAMPYLGFYGDWDAQKLLDDPAWEDSSLFYGNYFLDYYQGIVLGLDISEEQANKIE